MCGIAGWVDYRRDLTFERPILQAMTDTMACRGPDDEGLWIAPHAALGHRRLSVIDLEGGRQPMAVGEDGHQLAVITYSGEIYNYRELRMELARRGHRFRTASDTEVVVRAYVEWGEAFVEQLNGMYALAIWDALRDELLLVRDRMGIKPLYYAPTPAGVLFGSERKAILAHPDIHAAVDADGLGELVAVWVKTPGHALYRGMREVLPGEMVRVRQEGLSARRYWRLEARPHTDDLPTTAATVRGLLEDIVRRQLISDVPLCTLLSGGLDSSVITALAARARGLEGEAVRSFGVDYPGYADNFRADGLRESPDAPFARELSAHVGSEHVEVVLSAQELAAPEHRDAVLRANDAPNASGDLYTSMYLLFRAVRERSTVALSGESADEVFGGYNWFHVPAAVDADTFPWWATLDPSGGTELLDRGLLERLELAEYQRQSYRDALADVPRLEGETKLERRMREISHLALTRLLPILLDRKDRMSMACGLEVRVPFCDHRLVEYVFNAPWAIKSCDGREKGLLRTAGRDLLPPEIAQRRKSVYPTTQDPRYERALRAELAAVAATTDAPVRALVDAERLHAVLAEPVGAVSFGLSRSNIEMVLQLNRWLELYGVRIEV